MDCHKVELYEQLVKLLGLPLSDSSFAELYSLLGQEPDKHFASEEPGTLQIFARFGFHLAFTPSDDNSHTCASIFVYASEQLGPFEDGQKIRPFSGKLPFDVALDDTREVVRNKMGVAAHEPNGIIIMKGPNLRNLLDVYDMPPVELVFKFDSAGCMNSLTVQLQNLSEPNIYCEA